MDESAEYAIQEELAPTEKLLWCGRPRQGVFLRKTDALLIPFSILWGGFAIVWEAMAILSGAPVFFAIWGIPFVLVGLYIMVGRFWVDARQRAATIYALTSEQILIRSGLWESRLKSLDLASLSEISLAERSNGAGTITFGSMPFPYSWFAGTGWPGLNNQLVPTFELPEEAREVYTKIRSAQHAARRHP